MSVRGAFINTYYQRLVYILALLKSSAKRLYYQSLQNEEKMEHRKTKFSYDVILSMRSLLSAYDSPSLLSYKNEILRARESHFVSSNPYQHY